MRTREFALQNKPEFAIFINKFRENSEVIQTGNGGFENIHIMPIQRVLTIFKMSNKTIINFGIQLPRYELLLKELVKYTDREHEDFEVNKI